MRIERCQAKSPLGSQCTLEENKEQCIGKLTFCLASDGSRLRCQCAPNAETEGEGCKCLVSHVESLNGLQCLKTAEKVGDGCEEAQQCDSLSSESGSTTCSGGTCSCTGNYLENGANDKCLKKAEKLGDTCEDVRQCQVLSPEADAYACSGGTCSCTANYLGNGANNKCLKKAERLGEVCEENPQCVHLGNFEGSLAAAGCQALKCGCTTSSKEDGGRCFAPKKIDSSCETEKDCSNGGIEGSVTCSEDGKCSCGSGEEASEDKTKCDKAGGSGDSGASSSFTISFFVLVFTLVCLWM